MSKPNSSPEISAPLVCEPSHSEIYIYKRSRAVLHDIARRRIDKCHSFLDYEVVKRQAARCQMQIADFQRKYPQYHLQDEQTFSSLGDLGVQTQLF